MRKLSIVSVFLVIAGCATTYENNSSDNYVICDDGNTSCPNATNVVLCDDINETC